MAKSTEQRVREALGAQALQILAMQTTCDEQAEHIAALKSELEKLKAPPQG